MGELIKPVTLGAAELPQRGIRRATCEAFNVRKTSRIGEIVATYYKDGIPCGYHYRHGGWHAEDVSNRKTWWADGSERTLFGEHLLETDVTYDEIHLFEGETDTMAAYQNHYDSASPIAKIFLGLGGEPDLALWERLVNVLTKHLSPDGVVVIGFDNDKAGEQYTAKLLGLIIGKFKAVRLVFKGKDICEHLLAGHPYPTVFDCTSLPLRPRSIMSGNSLVDRIRTQGFVNPEYLTTGYQVLDNIIGGWLPGAFVMLAGAAKQGKSAFLAQLAVNWLRNHSGKILYIPLEMSDLETFAIIARCWRQTSKCDTEQLLESAEQFADRIEVVSRFGSITAQELTEYLSYAYASGIKFIVLDHITAAATSSKDGLSTQSLDSFLYLLKHKLNEYGLAALVATHVNCSETVVPQITDLRGSRALAQVPTVVLYIKREDGNAVRIGSITADRYTGQRGTFFLNYSEATSTFEASGDENF